MDFDRLAEELHAHGGTFDVPARSAAAPGAVPARLAGLRGLPQSEVAGIPLASTHLVPGPRLELLGIAMAQLAVVLILADVEVDVALSRIRVAGLDEAGDHRDHLGNRLGR